MVSRYFLLLLTPLLFTCVSAQTTSPEGRWATTDDETGEKQSIIEIYKVGDKYDGKIAEILTDKKDAICTECSGKLKGKPILGLVIVKDLVKDGDYWDGGTILDPRKGAEYKLSAWYESDPNVLYIRGKHWTGLYRTQTWQRVVGK
ncbi:DUF2147 domain-containing protein [Neolewinella antarctica]|uniref:Uncharacterized protein (DUF2147 family) n=1 Tax=Neolewinella antarctica TaxID=442734 RepID=A0ABX0XAT9_9BACT|nr:DUF2147 domain-containing protein [Neolewinella antarctica]NJC26350.1 uncharacterized protein (DUF2147 family) [Neolewinella antarctica]